MTRAEAQRRGEGKRNGRTRTEGTRTSTDGQGQGQGEKSGAHYAFDFKGVRIDPYRILEVYGISHPAQQHAIKKLLRAGRSVKTLEADIDEVIATLERWKGMIGEDQ